MRDMEYKARPRWRRQGPSDPISGTATETGGAAPSDFPAEPPTSESPASPAPSPEPSPSPSFEPSPSPSPEPSPSLPPEPSPSASSPSASPSSPSLSDTSSIGPSPSPSSGTLPISSAPSVEPSSSPSSASIEIPQGSTSADLDVSSDSPPVGTASRTPESAPTVTDTTIEAVSLTAAPGYTIVTGTVIVTQNGIVTTVVSIYPSALNTAPPGPLSNGERSGVIAGTVLGGTFMLLLLLFLIIFLRRRHARRLDSIRASREPLQAPRRLLETEDEFDLAAPGAIMTEWNGSSGQISSQVSRNGSIFHEGVWPPPGMGTHLQDPLIQSSSIDIRGAVLGHNRESMSIDNASSVSPTSSANQRDSYAPLIPPSASASDRSSGPIGLHVVGGLESAPRWTPSPAAIAKAREASTSTASPYSTLPSARPDSGVLPNRESTLATVSPRTVDSLVDLSDPPPPPTPPKEIPPLYHMIRRDTNQSGSQPR